MRLLTWSLRPLPMTLVVSAAVVVLALASAAGMASGSLTPLLLGGGLVALAAGAYLSVWATPALFASLTLASSVFSGYSSELGLPIGLDRLFMLATLTSLVIGLPGAVRKRVIIWRPVHALLGLAAAAAVVSSIAAGTLGTQTGAFSLLDRFGIVPFLLFTLAPLLFPTDRERNVLLVTMVALGTYLSITALLEATGVTELVWPGYITDPSVGIHFGRARGPFGEAVGNGLGLFGCAVGAAVATATWRTMRSRTYAGLVTVACLGCTMFTLTRAIWLATVVATGVALLANHRTRALLGPIVIIGTFAMLAALTFVPQFSEQAEDRAGSERPLWDRYNTNRAAIGMVRDEPLFGVGWDRFESESDEYLWLAGTYPLTGENLDVHNVFLSHAAELGVPTMLLWLGGLLAAVYAAVARPGPSSLDPWRLGAIAIFVHWAIVASFGPLAQAFPNMLLWLWIGIAGMSHTSAPLDGTDERSGRPLSAAV